MAEPLGAILSVLSRSIRIANQIQTEWAGAELKLLSLSSQLTALRAALSKIQEWMYRNLEHSYHQLVMDLDASLKCCRLLVLRIEQLLGKLADGMYGSLDFAGHVKIVFGTSSLNDVQGLLQQQISALTLLLTACNR